MLRCLAGSIQEGIERDNRQGQQPYTLREVSRKELRDVKQHKLVNNNSTEVSRKELRVFLEYGNFEKLEREVSRKELRGAVARPTRT